jgi:molybdopterin-guanine dinucleotide biosynthesis protein A
VQALRFATQLNALAVLVIPVDMPRLTTAALLMLVEQFRQQIKGSTLEPVVATFGQGRPEPLVAIYPTAQLASLIDWLQTPHRSLFRWLQSTPHQLVSFPAAAAANVNSPQDFSDGCDHPS